MASLVPRGRGVVTEISAAGVLCVLQLAAGGGSGHGVSSGNSGDGGSGYVVEPTPGGEAVGAGGRWFPHSLRAHGPQQFSPRRRSDKTFEPQRHGSKIFSPWRCSSNKKHHSAVVLIFFNHSTVATIFLNTGLWLDFPQRCGKIFSTTLLWSEFF